MPVDSIRSRRRPSKRGCEEHSKPPRKKLPMGIQITRSLRAIGNGSRGQDFRERGLGSERSPAHWSALRHEVAQPIGSISHNSLKYSRFFGNNELSVRRGSSCAPTRMPAFQA
jgi:hypothetical protein